MLNFVKRNKFFATNLAHIGYMYYFCTVNEKRLTSTRQKKDK